MEKKDRPERSIEEMRFITEKANLTQGLIISLNSEFKRFIDNPVVAKFAPDEQISMMISAYTSIYVAYGFYNFQMEDIMLPNELNEIREIITLEDKFKSEDNDSGSQK